MRTQPHMLPVKSSGTSRELISLHYGNAGRGKKVYIQSSLHADEIPGMLVTHYLRKQLEQFEAAGDIAGEIVLVPIANPIGLDQEIHGAAFGRFDLSTGINFNRGYLHLTSRLSAELDGRLGADQDENVRLIRQQAISILKQWQPVNETEYLKKTLQTLAVDADIVLDLHCDNQAVMHLYTGTPLLEATLPLAAYLGAKAVLTSVLSGDDPFDETCSRHWWELAQHFGAATPIPAACLAITVELRGETEVCHELARADAAAIIAFLQQTGHIGGTATVMPQALCKATPLEGVEPIVAAHAGILVFTKALGESVEAGESIGDLVDPLSGEQTPLLASVSGVLFARVARRYAQGGMRVAKIAGEQAFRTGNLLSL
ncbi:succinylglutamate desuccinylase/aspartoacylase family protein [Undibacterium piscinae]|uniref:Succinylglutamate desuccinylase/aspartoacylase family protein n=1 Tax=Undibacterium piscinae TaxID=2495591 RepID=A0A6M4A2S6_9BURK|nr:succinylglutamate desuccinylase/aspartoacylase family protein [Undibacterium piscinae]